METQNLIRSKLSYGFYWPLSRELRQQVDEALLSVLQDLVGSPLHDKLSVELRDSIIEDLSYENWSKCEVSRILDSLR